MGYQTPTSLGGGTGGGPIIIYPEDTVVNPESIQMDYTTIGAMSAPRVVYAGPSGLEVADKDTVSQQDKLIGVTITSAAAAGDTVKVVLEGKIDDPSFSFTPGPIWLGNAGVLTQTKPTSGLLAPIAVAITSTHINVNIGLAIKLA